MRPDPAQVTRLIEIIDNLNVRLAEAHQRGWLGEVEGLEATIAAADQKLTTMRRSAPVKLLPTSPPVPTAPIERDPDGQRP